MVRPDTDSRSGAAAGTQRVHASERILSLAQVGIIAADADLRITYANAAAARLLFREPSELVGTLLVEHVAPKARATARESLAQLKEGQTLGAEFPFETRQGGIFEGTVHAVPLFDEEGNYEGSIGSIMGEGRLRRAAREHAERARQLEELASTVDAVLWIADADTDAAPNTIFVSPAAKKTLGRRPEQLVGPPERWLACVHSEDRHRVAASRRFVLEGHNGTFEEEYRVVLPGGEVRWLLEKARGYEGESGGARSVYGVATDITEHRRAQDQRRRLDEKLQRKQKLESLGVLAGGVAHEFNNLLLAVIGNAELGLSMAREQDDELAHALEEILCAGQRAAVLSRQMLAYSGRGGLARRRICLGKLVTNTRAMLEMAAGKSAELEIVVQPKLPAVLGDAEQVKQVLINVVSNAGEALGDSGGLIRLSVGARECCGDEVENAFLGTPLEEGRFVTVEVVDDGEGMDPRTIERLFDPFFSTRFPGRGLGMSAVLGILQGHGGGINVDSRRGLGTRVELLFPVASDDVEGEIEEVGAREPTRARGPILVVDDEEVIRTLATRMLARLGLDARCASSGVEALELLRGHPGRFSAVLLDLTMPRMSGAQVLDEIRTQAPGVPVIVCSGYGRREVSERLGGITPEFVLHKPFRLEQLRRVVQRALSGPGQPGQRG